MATGYATRTTYCTIRNVTFDLFGIRVVEKNLWPMGVWELIYRSGKSELHTPYAVIERPTDTLTGLVEQLEGEL